MSSLAEQTKQAYHKLPEVDLYGIRLRMTHRGELEIVNKLTQVTMYLTLNHDHAMKVIEFIKRGFLDPEPIKEISLDD